MKTNEYVATLPDLEIAARVENIQAALIKIGNATTGEAIDMLFPHLSLEDKFKMAILVQIVIKNMNAMKR